MFAKVSLDEFTRRLADGQPTPGGGSAAAMAGAMGAGLISMFCTLTAGRKKYAAVKEEMEETARTVGQWRACLVDLIDRDSAAYAQVLTANRLPKETDVEKKLRRQAIDAATLVATRTPLETGSCCVAALELVPSLAAKGNPNALSDLQVGMELLCTAFTGARANVEINLPWLPEGERAEIRAELMVLVARAKELVAQGREEISQLQA